MILPNAERAVVEREKITEYLLNPSHPDNGGKAPFFLALGFTPQDWPVFAAALRAQAMSTPFAHCLVSLHGSKYVVDGPLDTPRGRTPTVRVVWIVDHGLDLPRLVTAYPHIV